MGFRSIDDRKRADSHETVAMTKSKSSSADVGWKKASECQDKISLCKTASELNIVSVIPTTG